jgi:ATP-dependent Lhr-like helicase
VWRQTDSHVYRDDSSPGAGPTETSDDLIRQVLYNDALRPMIPDEIIAEVEARLQRLRPGYAPREGDELLSWVAERVALTATEATQLREVIERDSGQIIEGDESPFTAEVVLRLCWVRSRSGTLLTTIDRLPALNAVLGLAVDDIASASHEWSIPPRSWKVNPTAADAIARQLELEAPPALSVLTEWLQFFGPRSIDWPVDALGLEPEAWESVRDELSDTGQIVMGRISSSATEEELCAAEVLEYLLRLKRKRERPVFKEVDQSAFVPFLADQTSVGTGGADPDALLAVLDRMFGYPCPASGWESDLIPSRVSGYYPIWLDGLVKEHGLVWIGCGKERVTLCLEEELDLFQAIGRAPEEAPEPDCSIERLLGKEGPLGYGEIRDRLGLSGDQTEESLWRLAWAGTVTNSSFATLRKGLLSGFTGEAAATRSGKRRWPGRQPSRQRSRSQTRPITGTWWLVAPGEETDPLIDLENDKERVRALLRRYGIVFRRLVGRELPHLRWSSLFKALRLMELSGEVVAGSFVGGADLPQFALPGVLERLAAEPRKDVYWISALDPASPCGLCLDTAYPDLPARLPGNHLVFRGSELVMTSTRYGADLLFHVEPDDPDIGEILGPLTNMVTRKWNPRRVSVETVNGLPVRDSPYSQPLERHGFRNEFRSFVLDAGYR